MNEVNVGLNTIVDPPNKEDTQPYMTQPSYFDEKGNENCLYKLKKALYGSYQKPRAWNKNC